MSSPQEPQNNPLALYSVAIGTVGQVGCLLFTAIIGSLILGLLLDQLLGTKPLFIFIFLLGSVPLNLWLIYRYTLHKVRTLQQTPAPKKEETARVD